MIWKKQWLFYLIFAILFLVVRLPKLGSDIINPDAVNWHYRSEQFIVGLKTQNWEKIYQHYHPGVTLMWIMGPVVEIIKHISSDYAVYNNNNFLIFHTASKVSVVLVQLILTLVAIYLFTRFFSLKKVFLVALLFSFEPFFVGNSRLLHLDVLMTLFLLNGLLMAFWAEKDFKWWKGILAGAFLSLAFLTKSISIGALLFVLVYSLWKKAPRLLVTVLGSFVVTTFILFPALWVNPVGTITNIFTEGERVGIRDGHGQIILGEYTRNAGVGLYPLVLLMKVSLATWIGVALYGYHFFKNIKKLKFSFSLELFFAIFYLGYFIVMTFPSKKIDRYMVPVFPFLALIAVDGYQKLTKFRLPIIGAVFSGFILLPLITFYPYYFTYTSPVFGSAGKANSVLAEKPFGVGIPALKEFIFSKYGEYPKLGFYDVKPMRSIYMNSRICDIRVCGTSDYDLLVLGINEEIPEKVLTSGTPFTYSSSFYINGLEYWKIYVKETSN